MAIVNRNTHCGSGHPDIVVMHDLVGFVDHFHFFLGIAVVQKIVDMGQAVVGDRVWVKLVFGALYALLQILVALDARAGDGLIGRVDDTVDPVFVIDGL